MNLIQRVNAPTPSFFKKLRTIGLAAVGIGTALLTAPVALPVFLVAAGGYLLTAGSVISAVSQLTTHAEQNKPDLGGGDEP